jgi:hypothetical protein
MTSATLPPPIHNSVRVAGAVLLARSYRPYWKGFSCGKVPFGPNTSSALMPLLKV